MAKLPQPGARARTAAPAQGNCQKSHNAGLLVVVPLQISPVCKRQQGGKTSGRELLPAEASPTHSSFRQTQADERFGD